MFCVYQWFSKQWNKFLLYIAFHCSKTVTDILSCICFAAGGGSEAITADKQHSDDRTQQVSATGFTPRSQVEAVRNCATVSHSIQSLIVTKLADRLLQTQDYVRTSHSGSTEPRQWNRGGKLPVVGHTCMLLWWRLGYIDCQLKFSTPIHRNEVLQLIFKFFWCLTIPFDFHLLFYLWQMCKFIFNLRWIFGR